MNPLLEKDSRPQRQGFPTRFIAILLLFFLFISPQTASATSREALFRTIKAKIRSRCSSYQSSFDYDRVLRKARREYGRFRYPSGASPAERDRVAKQIVDYALSGISRSLGTLNHVHACAHFEAAEETLSSYGENYFKTLQSRAKPLLKGFYKEVLTLQAKTLRNFLNSLGKKKYLLKPVGEKTRLKLMEAIRKEKVLPAFSGYSRFTPPTFIIDDIMVENLLEGSLGEGACPAVPPPFLGIQTTFGIPDMYKKVDPAQNYDLIIALFFSLPFDKPSIHLETALPAGFDPFYEIGPNYVLLYSLMKGANLTYWVFHDYFGTINLTYFWGDCPVNISLSYWIIKKQETNKNRSAWRNNRRDMVIIASDIAHKLLNACESATSHGPPPSRESFVFRPVTSPHIEAAPAKKDKCTLSVAVTDREGRPSKGVIIRLKKPAFGRLSRLNLVTNAAGEARVVYSAPTEKELKKIGKLQINVPLEATEVKTGRFGRVMIYIRGKTREITTRVAHEILPAHPDFYNTISFTLQAANRPDGAPYKATVKLKKDSRGVFTRRPGERGGVNRLSMNLRPGKRYDLTYHWLGPPNMQKPFKEVVTIEIPALKLRKSVDFSVGIDLWITAFKRSGGDIFPGIVDPFYVYVGDRFHPKTDLVKLLRGFSIEKLRLKITQSYYHPPSAIADLKQNGLFSAFLTRLEGLPGMPLHKAIIYNPGSWKIRKTRDHRFLLYAPRKEGKDAIPIPHPAAIYRERGSYKFTATLVPPKGFNAIPNDDTLTSQLCEVREFKDIYDEIAHTVFLPSYEFLLEAIAGFGEEMGPIFKNQSLPINLALNSENLVSDVLAKDYVSAFFDIFGAYGAVVDKYKKLSKTKKLIIKFGTLAAYGHTLLEKLPDLFHAVFPARGAAPEKTSRMKGFKSERRRSANDANTGKILQILQTAVKGMRKYYLVIIQMDGITRSAAYLEDGTPLRRLPQKITKATSPYQRIDAGKRVTVISANLYEKIVLDLSGDKFGKFFIVTPDRIAAYRAPGGTWTSTIEVDGTGRAAVKTGGHPLVPVSPISGRVNGVYSHPKKVLPFRSAGTSDTFHASHGRSVKTFPLNIAGTWRTTFGKMILYQHGNVITGHYAHDNGKIVGFLRGNVLMGKWSEAPTYKPDHDAGRLRLVFSRDGQTFNGKWGYGFEEKSWNGNWSGKKGE